MANWKDQLTDQLVSALLTLKNKDEVYRFLEDVATISEIKAWAQRLEVARLLRQDHTYPQITKITGASTATISRVRKFLDYGADGYRIALDRLGKQQGAKENASKKQTAVKSHRERFSDLKQIKDRGGFYRPCLFLYKKLAAARILRASASLVLLSLTTGPVHPMELSA